MTGIAEFDRVMGGGIMGGSLVLLAGDPGIGKSTLMTELARHLSRTRLLYVTGEESLKQVKLRARRLGIQSDGLFLLAESKLEEILAAVEEVEPEALVIDSIQTVYRSEVPSAPGSVSQVRECAATLLDVTKRGGFTTFLVGHVTKDGAIAGPRVLEHMVDTVLYFEGERHQTYRILRAVKNRFGSTNEIGLFEMQSDGLRQVTNPSEVFIGQRSGKVSGSTIVCALEGTRPLLVEIQALVSPTSYGTPQRTASGFDGRRLQMLLAVLEKRIGYRLSSQDVFINIAGGVRLEEPAVDLGVVVAIASSFQNVPSDPRAVVIGEVGLGGEVRSVSQVTRRLAEAEKLGLSRAVVPKGSATEGKKSGKLSVTEAANLNEALEALLL
jgi:DNA repair protein RadA/Sms